MTKARKMCFDRVLPRDLRRQQMTREMPGGHVRAIALAGRQWVNGSTIRIKLNGGSAAERKLVEQTAPRWTQYANLKFAFTEDPRAQIRVSFDSNDGAWSYIGLDNLDIPLHAATLNLGWVDEPVILHEFGHMIGLAHEHQNPDSGLIWNEAEVIKDLSGPPNFWDEQTIRHNVLNKYRADQIHGTKFDPESIMLYAFPDEWTQNPGGTNANKELSELDREFIAGGAMYPKLADEPEERATDLPVQSSLSAQIAIPGGECLFRFVVKRPGVHVVETSGSNDVVLTLLGPNALDQRIGEDDDGGVDTNARIRAELAEGTYFARVRHYSNAVTGPFGIRVTAH